MNKIKHFEDLEIWKDATQTAIEVYLMSEEGKLKNDFGMKDQIRRAAMSIADNIAEGFEAFIRFLKDPKGSAGELRNKLYVLNKVNFIEDDFYKEKYTRLIALSKQISSFIKYLK